MRIISWISILMLAAACGGEDTEELPEPPELPPGACDSADAGVVHLVDESGNNWTVVCD